MKRAVNSVRAAIKFSPGTGMLIINYAVLPILLLACFGLYFILDQGYLLHFTVTLAITSLVPLAIVLVRKSSSKHSDVEIKGSDSLVEASPDWGRGDTEAWYALNKKIHQQLNEKSDWGDLQGHALEVISETAISYGGKALSFSAPEFLKLCEEVSRRYRNILLQNVPAVEKTPCSSIKSAYDNQDKIRSGMDFLSNIYNVYRAYRLFSPKGIIAELRAQTLSKAFSPINDALIFKLKQALLQEVASVAIDLYSGRFRIGDEDIKMGLAVAAD